MALAFVGGKPQKVEKIENGIQQLGIKQIVEQAVQEQVQEVQEQEVQVGQQEKTLLTEEQMLVAGLVDTYTTIQKQLDAIEGLATLLKEQEDAKKQLQSIARSPDYAEDKPVRLVGTEGNYVEFSAKRKQTEVVDRPGLIQAMTQDVFNELAEVSLEKIKQVLTEKEVLLFTAQVPGSRTLKTVFYKK